MSETQFFPVKPVKVSQKFINDAYLLPHVTVAKKHVQCTTLRINPLKNVNVMVILQDLR